MSFFARFIKITTYYLLNHGFNAQPKEVSFIKEAGAFGLENFVTIILCHLSRKICFSTCSVGFSGLWECGVG